MNDYERALLRLLEVPSSPRLGLDRMRALLSRLDDPQRKLRALHVAGTNGKGSTLAFADAMLRAAGVRTGRTTSPHLTSATERIAIDGKPIDEETFVALEARVFAAAEQLDDKPTFFERVIAMAFVAFVDAEVEVALIEVGLGGRLDATNVIEPLAVAIANIGLDHQQFLGTTLQEVAREKAGILKPGVPAVSARQRPEVEAEIIARAREVGAPLTFVDRAELPETLVIGLAGAHQRDNAALAWALVDAASLPVDDAAKTRGLREVSWPARLEQIADDPPLIVDGAHNEAAAAALVAATAARGPCSLVVGMTRGHDGGALAAGLLRLAPSAVWAVQARAPRSRSAKEVAADLRAADAGGGLAISVAEIGEALAQARTRAAGEGGWVLVTGSLYLAGEVRARLLPMPSDPALPDF